MHDQNYPGFDVNPLIPVTEYMSGPLAQKIIYAGLGSVRELLALSPAEIKQCADLNPAEASELATVLAMVRANHK